MFIGLYPAFPGLGRPGASVKNLTATSILPYLVIGALMTVPPKRENTSLKRIAGNLGEGRECILDAEDRDLVDAIRNCQEFVAGGSH